LDIYWNILTMHVLINVKSPNNVSKWQMEFNSAFKGLNINIIWQKCLCVGEVADMDTEGGFAERYESFTFLVSVTTSVI
jgi:hypothetical protein